MNNHGSSVGATRNRGGNPTDKITPNVYYHHTLEPQATTIEHQQQLQQRQTNCNNFGEFRTKKNFDFLCKIGGKDFHNFLLGMGI